MFESMISLVAVVVLLVFVFRLNTRLGLMERELGALRSLVLSMPPAPAFAPKAAEAVVERDAVEAPPALKPESAAFERAAAAATVPSEVVVQEPEPQMAPEPQAAPVTPARRPDIETALGTRWAVWVGGLALALGGVFLVRYSIEAGIFGPHVRLAFAGLLGIVLVAGGEFVRRTGFTGPVEGAAGAYIPAILTAAGAFTLFGTVYAAHGIYGFIGPAAAFLLMGLIGVTTLAAALVHGQALAGVGLLGSMATPVLVASDAPNAWALFGYLAIVLVANTAVARLRDWTVLAAAGFAGTGLWWLVYMLGAGNVDVTVVFFINAVALAALALVWLARRPAMQADGGLPVDWPSIVPAIFGGMAALGLLADPVFSVGTGAVYGLLLVATMVAVARLRAGAVPLLHAGGAAAVFTHLRLLPATSVSIEFSGGELAVDGLPVEPLMAPDLWISIVLATLLLVAGFESARRLAASAASRAAVWSGWGALVPLVAVGALWLAFGNLDRDYGYAAVAFGLMVVLVAGGEAVARREAPPLRGGLAVSFALVGAAAAAVLALHMAFGPAATTVLVGVAAVVPALATRLRAYPLLGWLCLAAVVVVMGRIALDPTIVGAEMLGRTPVLNALLPGYGIPTLAFVFCAWQLARTTDGRPRLAMEAAGALFALLTLAMLVRHAMNGGVIDAEAPTLAEQAIYTLLALGAGAILIAIDRRSPSPVMRWGSIAAGVASTVLVVGQHFLFLNPLFTDEPTGRIPVFNLLFIAYLLPAVAAGALAWYARGKRPVWYSAMLVLLASLLAFAYATLSLRRLFQGENIALWAGMGQIETYAYSALWLAIGVALLVGGVFARSQILRVASAVLIAVSVAKVFIFDMSELQGVLRALSFIGLGAVLIGIGLFYQRLLLRGAARSPEEPAT